MAAHRPLPLQRTQKWAAANESEDLTGYWRDRAKRPLPPAVIRKIIRQTAADLKRPFVLVEHSYSYVPTGRQPQLRITIPRIKRCSPLVAPFILLAKNAQAPCQARPRRCPRWVQALVRLDQPARLGNPWFERCRTDVEWRKILGVTTNGNA
jgi:hypothetical protein